MDSAIISTRHLDIYMEDTNAESPTKGSTPRPDGNAPPPRGRPFDNYSW